MHMQLLSPQLCRLNPAESELCFVTCPPFAWSYIRARFVSEITPPLAIEIELDRARAT